MVGQASTKRPPAATEFEAADSCPCASARANIGTTNHRFVRQYPPTDRRNVNSRADGAGLVAQAMAGPIFGTFQHFSSGHTFVQAGNMCACRLEAKCRMMPD